MTDKFMCHDCLRSTFALTNPLACPHCGGTMERVHSAYVPGDDSGSLAYQYGESTEALVEKFLQDLENWRTQAG
jgi:hypothetical protein